jgi:outer membrane receptor protein involved in Fe transport
MPVVVSFFSISVYGEEEEKHDSVLGTVVVTGRGKKAKLLETNGSITIFTAKDIKNSGQTKLGDLISTIPGVISQKFGGGYEFSIRGSKSAHSTGAVIYVDGKPLNSGIWGFSSIEAIPVDIVEKIEVIKSPSASEFGANSSRGIILITTKRGKSQEDPFHVNVSVEYGSWNTKKGRAGVSGGLGPFYYSLSGSGSETEGFRHTDDKIITGEATIGMKIDGGSIELNSSVFENEYKYARGLPYWQLNRDPREPGYNSEADGTGYYKEPSENEQLLINGSLKFNYNKKNWLVNASVTRSRDTQDYKYLAYINSPTSRNRTYYSDRIDDQFDTQFNVGRAIIISEIVMNKFSIGTDYTHNAFEQDNDYPFDPTDSQALSEAKGDIEATRKILGINANNDFSLGIFRLQAGLRSNYVKYNIKSKTPEELTKEYDNDLEYSISPSLNVTESSNLFATYSLSKFYAPIGYFASDMEKDDPEAQAEDLLPETIRSIETGFRHQFGKGLNYSIILYYMEIEDKFGYHYNSSGDRAGWKNIGHSTHKGLEIEIDGRPHKRIGYRLGFTTIDAKWDRCTPYAYENPSDPSKSRLDVAGKKVYNVPEYEYSAGVRIYPLTNRSIGSLVIALDVHGFGEQYEDYNNNLKMEAAHFVDVKITWNISKVSVHAACTNILDKEWIRYSNSSGYAKESEYRYGFVQDGRYIGLGLSTRL